jgi:hypothetical protein
MDPVIRNPNFLKLGITMTAVAGAATLVVVESGLGWPGIVFLGVVVAGALFYLASWWRCTLRVTSHGVVVGRMGRPLSFRWEDIQAFDIRAPEQRTPFMLFCHWWTDQGRALLRDGSCERIRAIEPWHGLTFLTYFSLSSVTSSDELIERLNILARRGTAP